MYLHQIPRRHLNIAYAAQRKKNITQCGKTFSEIALEIFKLDERFHEIIIHLFYVSETSMGLKEICQITILNLNF